MRQQHEPIIPLDISGMRGPRLLKFQNAAARRASTLHWIYFIAGGDMVKIGATNRWPRKRLRDIAGQSPVPVSLLAVMPGQHREQELHDRFREAHSHGEWFRQTPEILAFIADLVAEHGELDERYGIPKRMLHSAFSEILLEAGAE